jgi:hypothetical protein
MTRYRLDPDNPRRLTDEEARRLDEAGIDYSDIPELDDEFFAKAKRPPITADEMQRRRRHVETAISENRLEGIETSDEARAICDAYIRGEIDAGDLVTEYKRRKPTP